MKTFDTVPQLTFPEPVADFLRRGYEKADVILEYGSGGSTAMAAGMAGKSVVSVESDKDWAMGLQDWFDRNPPVAKSVRIHYANIGPTKEWGSPVTNEAWRAFPQYPLSVWSTEGFQHPDVVLVDGRFRAACFLAVLFQIKRPISLYFDDYTVRPEYHEVERYGRPVEMQGRMARFDLTPMTVPPGDLGWIFDVFTRKR